MRASLLLASCLFLGAPSFAQTVWTGSSSTSWFDASNWSTGVLPNQSTDVTVPAGGNQPELPAGLALVQDLDVLEGAVLKVNGTGSLEVHGDLTLVASGLGTGVLELGAATSDVTIFADWNQNDATAVISSGGEVLFAGGSTITGGAVSIPFLQLATGTVTLFADVEFENMTATGGISLGAFDWVVTAPAATLSVGLQPIHSLRLDAGLLSVSDSEVTDLVLNGGELFIEAGADLFVSNLLDLQTGKVSFGNLGNSKLRVGKDLVASQAVTWTPGNVDMDGPATTIQGPGGGRAFLNRLRFLSGTATLAAPVEIASWVGSAGGLTSGDWIEITGAAAFLSSAGGELEKVRILAGQTSVFSSAVGELELLGGIMRIISGQTLDVNTRADLQAGEVKWLNSSTSKFKVHGDLIAGPGVTWGTGFIDMDGTTTIDGPGGTAARVGFLRLLSGTTTLLNPVGIDLGLEAGGGDSVGDWFELAGTSTTLTQSGVPGMVPHQVRLVSGQCVASSSTIGELEITAGILEVPGGQTLTVTGNAELIAGQLEFSGFGKAILDVIGDVRQVATAPAVTMNLQGSLRCAGIWTADAPIDLGSSFVEFADGSSITGASPSFGNLRLSSGATVSLLNIVEVAGRLENSGGTSQGLWFELNGPAAVLATGDNAIHEVRITAGVTTAEDASVEVLRLEGGELVVEDGETLTVGTSLELTAGTLSLDPDDSGLARIEVTGNVTMLGTTAAALTGKGGSVRCDGLWFGNGPADFGASFVEFGPGATVLGAGVSFGRIRFVEGAVSLNALTSITQEIVVDTDASVAGFFPLQAAPGAGNVLALSGAGTIAELHVIDGTVEAAGGDVALLRIPGGSFVTTGSAMADSVFLEGGSLLAREGGLLDVSGKLELTSGLIDFEIDPAGSTGLEARIEAGSVNQVAVAGGAGIALGILGCRGDWTDSAGLDLGLSWVEIGSARTNATIGGSAPSFRNLRIVAGEVMLLSPVGIDGRLENDGGSTSGDWFELNGLFTELATGSDELQRVRITGGQTRAFPSFVDQLELAAGELLVDATGTLVVGSNFEMIAGFLAFDPGMGSTAARIEILGNARQLGTLVGSVTAVNAALAVAGDLTLDAPLALGASTVELMSGARLLGTSPIVSRLRVRSAGLQGALPGQAASLEAIGGVTVAFEIEQAASLTIKSGGLALLPGVVSLDGTLEIGAGAFLTLAPTTTLTMAPGSRLGLAGESGSPAEVNGFLGGGYTLIIDGEFGGRNFIVQDMSAVKLSASATIGPEGLHAGLLDRGVGPAGGPLLELAMPGTFDFVGLDFLGGVGDQNLRRIAGGGFGEVTVHAFGGALGGAAFEDDPSQGVSDPDGLIVWENLPQTDLVVLDVGSDLEGVLGGQLGIDFSVINQGSNSAVGPWTDRLVLSANATLGDADDLTLAEYLHTGDELGGGLYSTSAQVALPAFPAIAEGTFWLWLVADVNDQVNEPGFEANNTLLSSAFELFATPRPNLVAFALDGPASADDGDEVELTWTVRNAGLGATDEASGAGGTWEDRIYLSVDPAFGGDLLLGTFPILAGSEPGGISPGGNYTQIQSVSLPKGISGNYYLIVRTDAIDEVSPESQEADNVLVAAAPMLVNQPDLPDLSGAFQPVVSTLGALFTDTEVSLDWSVTNNDSDGNGLGSANGAWRERFWLSFDPLLDPGSDTLIFEVAHEGLVEPLESYGGTQPIQLPSQPGTWFLLGESDALGEVNEVDEANNLWFQTLFVQAPAWTGSVATTFVEGLASSGPGTQQILLTGQSTKVGSVQLEPNAALTIRVRQGNTRRVFDVTTDAVGAYSFTFEPLVGEAGIFDVFCDHPAVAEDPLAPQASFTLHGLSVAPLDYSTSLVTGETRRVSFGISNSGAQALNNLSLNTIGLPPHLGIQGLVIPAGLAAGASDVMSFNLVALGDAPDPPGPGTPASFSFDFGFDLAGVPVLAKSVPALVWVTPFVPDLVAVGLANTVQIDAAGTTQVVFQIVNQGGAPATGATLSIDGPASLGYGCVFDEPFVLGVPADLGDIAPGESRLVAYTALASVCADLNIGTQISPFTATVVANEGNFTFPATLQVAAVPQTSLIVSVQDVASWWLSSGTFLNGNGPGLAASVVTISDVTGFSQSLVADVAGNVVFNGLVGGVYEVDIAAPVPSDGHQNWSGSALVPAGQTTQFEAYLPAIATRFELVGKENAQTGQVDFEIETTIGGPQELAVIEVLGDGALLRLDLAIGETAQFNLTILNSGAAPAEGIELFLGDLSDYSVSPSNAFIGDLGSGESVPIVITVQRTGMGDACDLEAANFGLRYFVQAAEPVWFWTPLFVISSGPATGCGNAIGGGAPPLSLPPPLAPPPAGPMLPLPAAYLGSAFGNGASPEEPVRPAPPTLVLPL